MLHKEKSKQKKNGNSLAPEKSPKIDKRSAMFIPEPREYDFR